jgi:hypothetical protein
MSRLSIAPTPIFRRGRFPGLTANWGRRILSIPHDKTTQAFALEVNSMRNFLPVVALTLFLVTPATALADTFDYSYFDSFTDIYFTYDSSVLITTNTMPTPLTCGSTTDAAETCKYVQINPPDGQVEVGLNGPSILDGFIGFPDVFAVGDYVIGGVIDWDIADAPSAPAVPEPASILLVAIGMLGLAFGLARGKTAPALTKGMGGRYLINR